jgi:hypothetical protein
MGSARFRGEVVNYKPPRQTLDGIFARPNPPRGGVLQGLKLTEISDGLSKTAMFAEVMRGAAAFNATETVHTTAFNTATDFSDRQLADGQFVPQCSPTATGTPIQYTGQQYFRGDLPYTFMYTHTLPPNWNVKSQTAATQRYNCGLFPQSNAAHIAASSYHPGGAGVVMADASTRFIADSVDFDVWQGVGSRAGGESADLN